MNPIDPERRGLLDELFADELSAAAPALEGVLRMVRQEKRVRARRRLSAVLASVVLLVSLAVLWPHTRTVDRALTVAPLPAPITDRADSAFSQSLRIERVDDEGLLALLSATPSALVKWPDGRRDLILVVLPSPEP